MISGKKIIQKIFNKKNQQKIDFYNEKLFRYAKKLNRRFSILFD